MSDVTAILNAIERNDPRAAEQLVQMVYDDLRRLASKQLAQERPGQTLQATALVHEAYVRLVGQNRKSGSSGGRVRGAEQSSHGGSTAAPSWNGRNHFFAAAAEAMRRILVENARKKKSLKHGRGRRRLDVDLDLFESNPPAVNLLALDEALSKLARESPARAELVKLRFFAGMTMPEAAQTMGISLATAERYWTYARTWLFAELRAEDEHDIP